MTGEEIVLGPLPKGITLAKEGMHKKVWNVLGHTYTMKAASASSFAFETFDPPGTGVPPHVHPTQDEHIYVLEGMFTLYLRRAVGDRGPRRHRADAEEPPARLLQPQRGPHPRVVLGEPGGPACRTVRQAAQPRGPGRGRTAVRPLRCGLPAARVGARRRLTKTADEILESLSPYCERASGAGHQGADVMATRALRRRTDRRRRASAGRL